MALYNQLAFALLVTELLTFIVLIIPLPFTWRRALFRAIATSPIIAKLQFGLKITFIFVFLLFVDACQHMLKLQREGAAQKLPGVVTDMSRASDFRSRKFLSERNFYLHGFTLFLSLILSRTYSLVLDLIKTQEELAVLKTSTAKAGKTAGVGESQAQKQLADLQKEYDALAIKYAATTGVVSNKKSD